MTNSRNTSNKTMNINNRIHDYYNTNNYNTDPGVSQDRCLSPDDCEIIKDAYKNNISDTITMAVANMLEKAYESGLTVDEIVMAIEETGFAKEPSPWYLRRVLENWAENGVTFSRIKHYTGANRAVPWWK